MNKQKGTTDLDKGLLVEKIRETFTKVDRLKYQRSLLEFFDNEGNFLGDNVFETTFELREAGTPRIYEVSGPYDSVSREYATIGRIYQQGEMLFECNLKPAILQRTAAMVWLYLDSLHHPLGNVLFIGAGKVGLQTALYMKHFSPGLQAVDYQDLQQQPDSFERSLKLAGLQTGYLDQAELANYDTIIMATNTTSCIINKDNFPDLKLGCVVVSLCTTSQSGEIDPELYGSPEVNTFLDYELSRTFTADMKRASDSGNLGAVIYFKDILAGRCLPDLGTKINLIRLTGTPMQNVAVMNLLWDETKDPKPVL